MAFSWFGQWITVNNQFSLYGVPQKGMINAAENKPYLREGPKGNHLHYSS